MPQRFQLIPCKKSTGHSGRKISRSQLPGRILEPLPKPSPPWRPRGWTKTRSRSWAGSSHNPAGWLSDRGDQPVDIERDEYVAGGLRAPDSQGLGGLQPPRQWGPRPPGTTALAPHPVQRRRMMQTLQKSKNLNERTVVLNFLFLGAGGF